MISTSKRRTRMAIVLLLALSLTVAACGTRLDRDTIISAGYAGASGGKAGATGQVGPDGESLVPGAQDGVPGSPDGDVASVPGQEDSRATGQGNQGGTAGSPGGSSGNGLGGQGAGGGGGGGPIVIGSVGSYSGPVGTSYAGGARALQAWASAINAKGGINGRKVQVHVYDDGANGAKARSQVQELVEERKAVAVVASMATLTLAQWRGYVEEKKIPVIGGDCALDMWNESPVLFTQCATVDTTAWSVVSVGGKLGKSKKWGALICTEAPTCGKYERLWWDDGWAKKAGLEPLYRARISVAQADFTSECISARNAGVELLTVLSEPSTVARVAASCRRQNYQPKFLQGGGGTIAANTPSQPGLGDVLASAPTFPFAGLNTPAAQEFYSAWQRYGGGSQPDASASLGWTAAKIFEKAAKKAGADVTPAGLIKALTTISNDRIGGLAAPITYRAGKPALDFKCWFVMQAKNGKWTAPQGDRLSCR